MVDMSGNWLSLRGRYCFERQEGTIRGEQPLWRQIYYKS